MDKDYNNRWMCNITVARLYEMNDRMDLYCAQLESNAKRMFEAHQASDLIRVTTKDMEKLFWKQQEEERRRLFGQNRRREKEEYNDE